MPYIILLIFTFLFIGCNPAIIPQAKNERINNPQLPITHQDNDIDDLKITDEDSIVGHYLLKMGFLRNQKISEGYLVIEEIDVNNYGYYYVTVIPNLTTGTHTGIFFQKGGKYVQKVIEDASESEVTQGKNKSKMSIIDNMELIQEGQLLKLYINSNKKEKLIWERDVNKIEKSVKVKEALQVAKHEYLKYYEEKCAECSQFCGDSAYTKIN